MKELSIEEKAERYDEAVNEIKGLRDMLLKEGVINKNGIIYDNFNRIFPELKESEDEKIKKMVLKAFKLFVEKQSWIGHCLDDIDWDKCIAWLEKQGKKKFEQKFFINDKVVHKATGKIWTIHHYLKDTNSYYVEDNDGLLHHYTESELKLVEEQKPADKVEAKFHKDDWIIHQGTENIYQVVAVIDNQYQLKYGDNYTIQNCADVDRCARLWDITKDAKDGDVLVNQNGEMPFIFKECKNNHIYCYCGYTNRKDIFFNRFVDSEGDELHWLNLYHEQAYPATKEQRDLLFQKMKEAGYTFNFEKKELKKIEQIPVDLPNGEDYGIDGLYAAVDILQKTLGNVDGYQSDDGILEHKCAISAVKQLAKQNNAWSEEDEKMIQDIINDIAIAQELVYCKSRCEDEINWLKSLKDKVQPKSKQEWSEEDDKMINSIAVHLNAATGGFPEDRAWADKFMIWLKSLKDRVQPKPEWSEEDERCINDIMWCIEAYRNNAFNQTHIDTANRAEEWLKSLRPQSTWKLSDRKANE